MDIGRSKHVARVAALAVALGVGTSIISWPAVAVADNASAPSHRNLLSAGAGNAPSRTPDAQTTSAAGTGGLPSLRTAGRNPSRVPRVVSRGAGASGLAGAPAPTPPLIAILAPVRRILPATIR